MRSIINKLIDNKTYDSSSCDDHLKLASKLLIN